MKILVVDDSEVIRELVGRELGRIGHTVVLARDGQEAWELLDQGEKFDRIVSDNNMPKMGGVELLQRVRADDRTADTPFILMSGDVVVSFDDSTLLEKVCAKLDATFLPKSESGKLLSLLGT